MSATKEPNTLTAKATDVAEALTAAGPQKRSDRGDLVQVGYYESGPGWVSETDTAGTLRARIPEHHTVQKTTVTGDVTHTLKAEGFDGSEDGTGRGMPITNESPGLVRRLTPTECERLQGFPDGWTTL